MLLILTGDIQIGKSRWLLELVDELESQGVTCYGVMAPGVWVESTGAHANDQGFEKLGIDNVLLPQRERLRFADRLDIARSQGSFVPESQAGRAQLGWHIDDAALAQVNAHLAGLREQDAPEAPGLLVVDELGRLELSRGEGLVEAMRLLGEGPSALTSHALVVARDSLAPQVEERFGAIWGGARCIGPDDASKGLVFSQIR